MAVVVIQDFEATIEEYDKVSEKLQEASEGLIVHTGFELGGGKMRVIDVWESQENYESFVQERLVPAIAEAVPDAPPADIQVHEVHDLLRG